MTKGNIIVLNGVSSSGKTTLSKTLQERFPDQYFLLPVDIINDISPQIGSLSYDKKFSSDPKPVISSFYGCVKAFSDNGQNVIVDTIFAKDTPLLLEYFLNTFPDCNYPVLLVHVTCPVDELRRREAERGDRQVGHAESLLSKLEPQDTYDLTVDTFSGTKEECSDKIIALSECMTTLSSFRTLWLQHNS